MPSFLRVNAYPYINYTFNSKTILYAEDLTRNIPALSFGSIRSVRDKILLHIAFAAVYGLEDQFISDPSFYTTSKDVSFKSDKFSVHLALGKSNEKLGFLGSTIPFKVPSRVARNNRTDYTVLAVFNVPHIKFIGWLDIEDLKYYVKGYSSSFYSGSSRIKPMKNFFLESFRVKGKFV